MDILLRATPDLQGVEFLLIPEKLLHTPEKLLPIREQVLATAVAAPTAAASARTSPTTTTEKLEAAVNRK